MIPIAGQRWFVAPFVATSLLTLAFCYATYDPIPPRVYVRWSDHVTASQRVALEAVYHLAEREYADGTTWSYGLLDTSTDNIQRLVQDPAAADTHMIDRDTFELTEPLPAPLLVLFGFLVLSSMIGVVVASFVTWVALLPRRAGRWWRAFLDARRSAVGDNEAPLRLVERTARSLVILVVASYFYMLMEWLFFATKPSFMSRLTMWEVFSIPVTTPLVLVAAGVPFWVAATLLLAAVRRVRLTPLFEWTLFLAPAAITAAAVLLLLDNFTYVLFGHNLGGVQGPGRYAYAALFSGVLVELAWSFERRSHSPFWRRHPRSPFVACGVLVGVSLAIAVGNAGSSRPTTELSGQPHRDQLANVLILSADGLNADHMSAYGYKRDTTPFIKKLLPEFLVAENHLSNNERTAGSIGALLTGKLSTATRVFDWTPRQERRRISD